ncbi:MAG: metalloregulator ArsR/SmtB family transcription factor [Eubacteriales bacterium]|jgi:DNA-binding transcriptional ArsR family regulator|nr:metalloregulator ArsR/SmtB family transcription factor [Eubacteriales bacterium]
MELKAKQIAQLLKVLANENRLMILCALMKGPMAVGKIAEKVSNISQPALSQHLALLKAHGIVDATKNGQNIIYSISDHRAGEVINALKKYYCDF